MDDETRNSARVLSFTEGAENRKRQVQAKLESLSTIAEELGQEVLELKARPVTEDSRILLKEKIERLSLLQDWIMTGGQWLSGDTNVDQKRLDEFLSL